MLPSWQILFYVQHSTLALCWKTAESNKWEDNSILSLITRRIGDQTTANVDPTVNIP
jgi:hypothetical protein